MSAPIALGGAPLLGGDLVRFVYLDESGTGDPKREPWVVVCAVIVHADKQWRALTQYLSDLADEVVPKAKRSEFVAFHAVELFSGGKIFERDPTNFEKWWPILDELLTIPEKFDLPIVYGRVARAWYLSGGKPHQAAVRAKIDPLVGAQMASFTMTARGVEHWMEKMAADEVAQMVMENNDQSQRFIRLTQRFLTHPDYRSEVARVLPEIKEIRRIIWPIHFEDKADSSALQIADVCAWAIRRRLSRERHSERFFAPLRKFLVNKSAADTEGDVPLAVNPSYFLDGARP